MLNCVGRHGFLTTINSIKNGNMKEIRFNVQDHVHEKLFKLASTLGEKPFPFARRLMVEALEDKNIKLSGNKKEAA